MANIFKVIRDSFTTKTSPISLRSHNISEFQPFGSFFNFLTGNTNFQKFTKAYGDNPLVYMVIRKISVTSASIKRIAVNDSDEEVELSRYLEILNNPNKDQGQIEFLTEINEYLLTTGNNYVRIIKGIGMDGVELTNLVAPEVEIICDSIGDVLRYKYRKPNGKFTWYEPDEILHLKTTNIVDVDQTNIKYGLSPLKAAWIVVRSSSEKLNAEASIFKNRGIIGILTSATDTPILPDERERMQNEFQDEAGGSTNYNKIKISSTKLNYLQTGMSPTDLKLLEGIVSSLRLICSVYGISSVLFNDNENSTYNNVAEAVKASYNEVYIPLGNKVDRELSNFLSEQLGLNEELRIDLTSISEIKASTNELAQSLNSLSPLVANRVLENLTINEIRDLVGQDTVPGGEALSGQSETVPNVNV